MVSEKVLGVGVIISIQTVPDGVMITVEGDDKDNAVEVAKAYKLVVKELNKEGN